MHALQILYPEIALPSFLFNYRSYRRIHTSKSQSRLVKVLQSLLPHSIHSTNDTTSTNTSTQLRIITNYYLEGVSYSVTHGPIQLDIYIPDFHLAFEYQGKQHYESEHSLGLTNDIEWRRQKVRTLCTGRWRWICISIIQISLCSLLSILLLLLLGWRKTRYLYAIRNYFDRSSVLVGWTIYIYPATPEQMSSRCFVRIAIIKRNPSVRSHTIQELIVGE